jgi:hypothetical protein
MKSGAMRAMWFAASPMIFDVADNPILNQRVLPECFNALQRLNVAGRARNGFGNMT